MNDNQQNFDELKRLLKLKQYEVPPPGYFNRFSDNVVSRIRAGEAGAGQTMAERLNNQAPWLLNFIRLFDARPGMIGGMATSLCLLLVLGVVFAEYSEQSTKEVLTIPGSTASSQPENSLAALAPPVTTSAIGDSSGGIVASTNPVTSLSPVATLFGQSAGNPLFQSASFAPVR
jgi:hypothetical protein